MKTESMLHIFGRKLKMALFQLLDQCLARLPFKQNDGGVVIIRTDGIGDFVLWLDAAHALANYYHHRGQTVTLLASSAWSEWATEFDIFDEVVSIDRSRFDSDMGYRVQIAMGLRRRAFAAAIQPIYSRRYFEDILLLLSRAPERIGWAGDLSDPYPRMKRIRDGWYTRLVKSYVGPRMEILRNGDFARQVAEPKYLARMPDLRSLNRGQVPESFRSEMPLGEPYYVLCPGASFEIKRWPEANYAELAKLIFMRTGWRGIVCGGTEDREAAASLCAAATAPLLNWAGRTSISELSAILSQARLLVANDTGAAHIAAALGTPTVCLLGGGHYGRFFPYQVEKTDNRPLPLTAVHAMPCFGCHWKCIFPVEPGDCGPCIGEISIDQVWTLVSSVV